MIKINFISSWTQGIIVSVIIATIIEMILPEGNNSKYVKMVIGVFVLFTIISPVINKLSGKNNVINLNSYIETSASEATKINASLNNDDLIKQMYEENLKIDMKTKISQKGYTVGELNLEILNDGNYTLNSINMKIAGKVQNENKQNNRVTSTIVENVGNILINVSGEKSSKNNVEEKSVISENEKRNIVQYLCRVYEVKENNIWVH